MEGVAIYNLMAAGYLIYLRIGGEFTSHLLLPACGLHALLGLMLARPAYLEPHTRVHRSAPAP